jgi:hypothetical protein
MNEAGALSWIIEWAPIGSSAALAVVVRAVTKPMPQATASSHRTPVCAPRTRT